MSPASCAPLCACRRIDSQSARRVTAFVVVVVVGGGGVFGCRFYGVTCSRQSLPHPPAPLSPLPSPSPRSPMLGRLRRSPTSLPYSWCGLVALCGVVWRGVAVWCGVIRLNYRAALLLFARCRWNADADAGGVVSCERVFIRKWLTKHAAVQYRNVASDWVAVSLVDAGLRARVCL